MGVFKRNRKATAIVEENINITPLMDVLTVLLFFFISIFTVNPITVTIPDNIQLPASKVISTPEEAVTISISKNKILANNQVIISIPIKKSDLASDNRTLVKLEEYLQQQMKKRNKIFEGEESPEFLHPGKILFQADRHLDFGTLKYLLHTAAVVGYADYQFLVTN